jgi:hypothetical protein
MTVPKEIEKYLTTDEVIEQEFHLRSRFALTGYKVYASNKRLFIMKRVSIKDIDYSHISSIELSQEGSVPAVVVGLLFLVAGVVLACLDLMYWWTWALVGLGLVLLILGLIRTQVVKLVVVGLRDAETLAGHRSGLDALLKIARERRL